MDAAGFAQALGWALLNFLWQGLVIGALAGLLLSLLRSPRWRYGVCALALLSCLMLPLAHLLVLLNAADEPPLALTLVASPLPDWLPDLQALAFAWSLGVGLMSLRLGLGLLWVARLRRSAQAASAFWQARVDALARRMGLARSVTLKVLPELSSPLTVGWLRPVILVPAALLTGMPAPLLEALLAHELAHVRRWDYLVNLLQSLIEALLFFHPVVWWISSRMRAEREQVADELAARALDDDPRRLAQALHALSRMTPVINPVIEPSTNLVLSARGGLLFQRIERLLTPQPQTPAWKLALPALLLASTSLLVQAAVSTPVHGLDGVEPAASAAAPAAMQLLSLPVNARHALVMDDATGRVIFSKDADAQVPIASLTKLLTAMVVLDARLDPRETIKISREDVNTFRHSKSRLAAGAEIARRDALTLMLMASENRAATALARHYPGGSEAFVEAMQAKARSLGLTRTVFAEPSGASPANLSTAAEFARLTVEAARYPEIAQITREKAAQVPVNGRPRALHNTNPLVGSEGWDIELSKTGFSSKAGRCLALRMKSGERSFTVVLLDADDSPERLHDAARIRQLLAKLPA